MTGTLASATEPAFSVDQSATILDWNEGAERLFGYAKVQVVGRRCWEVLTGYDVFGNEYCTGECPLIGMAVQHKAVRRCELLFRTASDESIHVGVSTMALPGEGDGKLTIVHLFTLLTLVPAGPQPLIAELLTGREIDVLQRLGTGQRMASIAHSLTLSEATVRNHIQQILRKLEVHTRLEAVCVAWRRGWIDRVEHNVEHNKDH